MARSVNRRTVELPAALYDELAQEAKKEGTTLAAHLQNLIIDGRAHREWFGRLESALWELQRTQDRQVRVLERIAGSADQQPTARVGKG